MYDRVLNRIKNPIIFFETFLKSLVRLSRLLKVLSCPRLSRLANAISDRLGTLETQILEFSGEMVFFVKLNKVLPNLLFG